MTIICSKCGKDKPIEEFVKNKRLPGGREHRCKQCKYAGCSPRPEYNKLWREEHPDYFTEWLANHPHYYSKYERKNPDRDREMAREWRRKNNNRFIALVRMRRALEAGTTGSFTEDEFRNICIKYGWECLKCGKSFPIEHLHRDHILPLSKGGSNFISNIQPLCKSCNSSKKDKNIDYRPDAFWADWT